MEEEYFPDGADLEEVAPSLKWLFLCVIFLPQPTTGFVVELLYGCLMGVTLHSTIKFDICRPNCFGFCH